MVFKDFKDFRVFRDLKDFRDLNAIISVEMFAAMPNYLYFCH